MMQLSKQARDARKAGQVARLAAKADKKVDYAAFYASQPLQVAKAAANEQIRMARKAARQALADFELARATGINIDVAERAFGEAGTAFDRALQTKHNRFKAGAGSAGLSGGVE